MRMRARPGSRAPASARARAAEAAEAAVRALDALPDTETRTAMVELARLSVSRDA